MSKYPDRENALRRFGWKSGQLQRNDRPRLRLGNTGRPEISRAARAETRHSTLWNRFNTTDVKFYDYKEYTLYAMVPVSFRLWCNLSQNPAWQHPIRKRHMNLGTKTGMGFKERSLGRNDHHEATTRRRGPSGKNRGMGKLGQDLRRSWLRWKASLWWSLPHVAVAFIIKGVGGQRRE